MKRQTLLPLLLTATLLIVVANFAVDRWSSRMPFKKVMDAVAQADHPNLLFLGNSMIAGHVDLPKFTAIAEAHHSDLRPVNVGIGATASAEHQLLFDYSLRAQPQIRTLVIGFDDAQLTAFFKATPNELKGNTLIGIDRRVPLEDSFNAYGFTPLERVEFRMLRCCPAYAFRSSLWRDVELLRRQMSSIGMPAQKSTALGRVKDFESLDASMADYFHNAIPAFNANPTKLNANYESILNSAQQHGIRVILLVMPISEHHRAEFYSLPIWHTYLENLRKLAATRKVEFIDGSNWVNGDKSFDDPLHMSASGVEEFTTKLADSLTTQH